MLSNVFSGYFSVTPENMVVPIAMFLSETEAKTYAEEKYGKLAIVSGGRGGRPSIVQYLLCFWVTSFLPAS